MTKFSKFLSACALLHYDSVATLPHWMDDASINELLPRAHANESPTDEENPPAAKPRTLAEATGKCTPASPMCYLRVMAVRCVVLPLLNAAP